MFLGVTDGVILGVTELVGVTDGVTEGVTELVTEGVTDGVTDGVLLGVIDGVTELVGVTEGVTDGVTELVTDGVTELVTDGVTEAVSVFGGSGIAAETLNVSIDPPLPAGLVIKTNKVQLSVAGSAPTVSGSGTVWNVTYSFTTPVNSAQVGRFYAVRGQTKTSYNGIWECTAVTSNTITLRYNANPAASGGSTPPGQVSWNTLAATVIVDAGVKSLTAADTVNYWYNYLDVAIEGTPSVASASRSYVITFTDALGNTGSTSFTLGVESNTTQLSATVNVATTTLVQNTAAVAFSPITASGGENPLTFSISPALPTGLTFNQSTGQISGTPTQSIAATNFTITVTDNIGQTAANSFSLVVNAPPALLLTQTVTSRTLIQNTLATSFIPVSATGGVSPLSYSINPTLPAGLTFNTVTGNISGTPTISSAERSYTVTITDSIGQNVSATPGQWTGFSACSVISLCPPLCKDHSNLK